MINKKYFLLAIALVFAIGSFIIVKNKNMNSSKAQESSSLVNTPAPTPPLKQKKYNQAPEMIIDESKNYQAKILTSEGEMVFDLFSSQAPTTVNNFVFLSREGFYDSTVFHRIIKGFMIQTGDPTGTGTGSPGYTFKDEPVKEDYTRGTLAMANSGPNTNGCQFFIIHQDYNLPKNYTIFGRLILGEETLDKIANIPVSASLSGEMSSPTKEVKILSLQIEEK